MKSAIRTRTHRLRLSARSVLAALLLGAPLATIVPTPAEAFVLIRRPSGRVIIAAPRPAQRPVLLVSPAPVPSTRVIHGRHCVRHRGHWGYWRHHRFIVVR